MDMDEKEKRRIAYRKWRENHPERAKEFNRIYRLKNLEKERKRVKEWIKNNKHKHKETNERCRKRRLEKTMTDKELKVQQARKARWLKKYGTTDETICAQKVKEAARQAAILVNKKRWGNKIDYGNIFPSAYYRITYEKLNESERVSFVKKMCKKRNMPFEIVLDLLEKSKNNIKADKPIVYNIPSVSEVEEQKKADTPITKEVKLTPYALSLMEIKPSQYAIELLKKIEREKNDDIEY